MDYSFLRYESTRPSEFWCGVGTFLHGCWLLLVSDNFVTNPTFTLAVDFAPQWGWAISFIAFGLMMLIGVGKKDFLLRFAGVVGSIMCWGMLAWFVGFANWRSSGIVLFGGVTFELYFLLARLMGSLRSSRD